MNKDNTEENQNIIFYLFLSELFGDWRDIENDIWDSY